MFVFEVYKTIGVSKQCHSKDTLLTTRFAPETPRLEYDASCGAASMVHLKRMDDDCAI